MVAVRTKICPWPTKTGSPLITIWYNVFETLYLFATTLLTRVARFGLVGSIISQRLVKKSSSRGAPIANWDTQHHQSFAGDGLSYTASDHSWFLWITDDLWNVFFFGWVSSNFVTSLKCRMEDWNTFISWQCWLKKRQVMCNHRPLFRNTKPYLYSSQK